MNTEQCYRINQPDVIAEVIDNEAILVNLDTGAYYSLRDSACTTWELLVHQMSVAAVVQALSERYSGAPDAIAESVDAYLAELLQEQLLVPAEGPAAGLPEPAHNGSASRVAFQPPVLEKFTDMADLLLLDPIHEVDTTGWPHAAPQG